MAFYSQALPSYTIGDNAYDDIPRVCEPYGSTAVVIGGKRAMQAARQYLIDALKDSKIKILDFVWYGGEASFENGDALIENPVVKQADMVFSMGGGKCVDCVKYVCYKLNKPLFALPTIAGTCAPVSSVAVMYYPNGVMKETYTTYSFSLTITL